MRVYLDNAATTMVRQDVIDAMIPAFTTYYGNPSSLHEYAQEAAKLVEDARADVAAVIGAKPDEKGYATKFFFGIPGRFLDEEQPDGGRSGFTSWQPIRGADPVFESYRKGERSNRNAYGYWIVAVDGKTGSIDDV